LQGDDFMANALEQRASDIFNSLGEKEQGVALYLLQHLFELSEDEKQAKNEAYLAKIRRGIKQCTEERGIMRDIVEVDGDE